MKKKIHSDDLAFAKTYLETMTQIGKYIDYDTYFPLNSELK